MRWGGSTAKAPATFLAVLLPTGAPRSAFLAVVETPAAAARSRLVIPRPSVRVFVRSGNSTMLWPPYTQQWAGLLYDDGWWR